jgi:hypothetical protein
VQPGVEFVGEQGVDASVARDQPFILEGIAYNQYLEVRFRAVRHVVHVTLVDDLHIHWAKRALQPLFDSVLSAHDITPAIFVAG